MATAVGAAMLRSRTYERKTACRVGAINRRGIAATVTMGVRLTAISSDRFTPQQPTHYRNVTQQTLLCLHAFIVCKAALRGRFAASPTKANVLVVPHRTFCKTGENGVPVGTKLLDPCFHVMLHLALYFRLPVVEIGVEAEHEC
jgi:hypothetical protein